MWLWICACSVHKTETSPQNAWIIRTTALLLSRHQQSSVFHQCRIYYLLPIPCTGLVPASVINSHASITKIWFISTQVISRALFSPMQILWLRFWENPQKQWKRKGNTKWQPQEKPQKGSCAQFIGAMVHTGAALGSHLWGMEHSSKIGSGCFCNHGIILVQQI